MFSKFVSLFLFCKQVHLYHFFPHFTYKRCHTIFLLLCLDLLYSWHSLGSSVLLQMGKVLNPNKCLASTVNQEWALVLHFTLFKSFPRRCWLRSTGGNEGRQQKRRCVSYSLGFPGDPEVKNPPAMQKTQETQVWSLGQEDSSGGGNGNPLQYSCCRIPWTDETGGLQSWGCKDSDMTEVISHSMLLFSILKLHHLDLALPINQ